MLSLPFFCLKEGRDMNQPANYLYDQMTVKPANCLSCGALCMSFPLPESGCCSWCTFRHYNPDWVPPYEK